MTWGKLYICEKMEILVDTLARTKNRRARNWVGMLITSLFFTSNATEEVSNTKPWTYRNLKNRLIQLHIRLELYILSTENFPVLFRWDCFISLVLFFFVFSSNFDFVSVVCARKFWWQFAEIFLYSRLYLYWI